MPRTDRSSVSWYPACPWPWKACLKWKNPSVYEQSLKRNRKMSKITMGRTKDAQASIWQSVFIEQICECWCSGTNECIDVLCSFVAWIRFLLQHEMKASVFENISHFCGAGFLPSKGPFCRFSLVGGECHTWCFWKMLPCLLLKVFPLLFLHQHFCGFHFLQPFLSARE